MIKIDVISGFLGVGKTTIIKELAKFYVDNGLSVVIIENEFGKIGIDGTMLQQDGLTVFEIEKGCICCSLKTDFITTLLQITDKIKPDRIIIEPSGIFILSEIYDILKESSVREKCVLNNVITIVDVVNYINFQSKYNFYFENQVKYSNAILLNKIESQNARAISLIKMQIKKLKPNTSIFNFKLNKNKQKMFTDLFLSINRNKAVDESPIKFNKHNHNNFESIAITINNIISLESLKQKLEKISNKKFGKILRLKGYVNTENSFVEVNYVNGNYDIKNASKKVEPVISIIGENLDKALIEKAFI